MAMPSFLIASNIVQGGGGNVTSSSPLALNATGANVVCGQFVTAVTVTSVTATYGGQSLTMFPASTSGNCKMWTGYLLNPPSGSNNLVFSWTTGINEYNVKAFAYQNNALVSAFGTPNINQGTGTSVTSSVTTTQINSRIITFLGQLGGTTFSPSNGQTKRDENSDQFQATLFDQSAVSINSYNDNYSLAVSRDWAITTVELKENVVPPFSPKVIINL